MHQAASSSLAVVFIMSSARMSEAPPATERMALLQRPHRAARFYEGADAGRDGAQPSDFASKSEGPLPAAATC